MKLWKAYIFSLLSCAGDEGFKKKDACVTQKRNEGTLHSVLIHPSTTDMAEHQYQQFRKAGIIERVCVRIASTFANNGSSSCHVSLQDIRDVFPDAQRFKLEELPIPFLIDPNGNRVEPPCIAFYPYKILDVITEAPQLGNSNSSSSSTEASSANTSSTNTNTNTNTNTSTNTNTDNTNSNSNSNHSAAIHLPTFRKSAKYARDTLSPLSNLIQSFNSLLTTRNNAYIEVVNFNLEKVADLLLEAEEKDDKVANLLLETKEKDSEMFKLQEKMLKLQEEMLKLQEEILKLQLEAKEKNEKMQHQSLDKLALLQQHVDAILTQNAGLHECLFSRLFIILPVDHTKWDPMNVLKNKLRVHFLCECGDHTTMTSKSSQSQLHIANHDGYEIRDSARFFRKYGKHIFILLQWLKLGMSSSTSLALSQDSIDAGIDCSIDYMEALSKEDPTLNSITTIDDYDDLNGSDFQNMRTTLRVNDESRQFGDMYRIMTETGRTKWVCLDHCRSMYEEKEQKAFINAVKVNSGKYNSHLGKLTITLESRERAKELFDALSSSIRVYELDITFDWDWTEIDLEAFESALAVSSVSNLRLGLARTQGNTEIKAPSTSGRYERLIRIMELSNMKTIHIALSQDLIKLLSLRPRRSSRLHKLTYEMKAQLTGTIELQGVVNSLKTSTTLTILNLSSGSIGGEGTLALSGALKANTSLTTLNLSYNRIGKEGALALSEALKVNTSLTTLDLSYNRIGKEGALALSEALKANATLATLSLSSNSIGKEGAQALSEALKVNNNLSTLSLGDNSIGKEGALALSEVLKANATLATLSLWGNSIGKEGALALSEALKVNTNLTTLNLNANSIGKEGALALSEALKVNATLTALDLMFSSIGDKAALAISEALKENAVLTQ